MPNRALLSRHRPPRLPVWPVAAGLVATAAEFIGARAAADACERRFGGRVTPAQLPDAASPFLLVVHHTHTFGACDPLRPLSRLVLPEGFPAHPHRGFETVTYVLEGGLRHRDSEGVAMTTRAGSVQWLTAGRGVLHEEMWSGAPRQELYQLWVDLPSDRRFDPPQIQVMGDVDADGPVEQLGPAPSIDAGPASLTLLAGTFAGRRSPVVTRSALSVGRVQWSAAGAFRWPEVPDGDTALVVVRRGAVWVGGEALAAHAIGLLTPGALVLDGDAGADALVLCGPKRPRPPLRSGPWVVDDPEQLEAAEADFAAGRFGRPWPPSLDDAGWRRWISGGAGSP